eukprot:TRINITY_DN7635_c0_g1_i2.p1 TRINITY_DN7635_c0_g1~~TRINITY_DN7635_c0_g1_i2.p1  ORF type:complete len:701 (+),score=127.51 TRINITY_DN7635_c0_g1_i2:288-2105(+)
MVLAMLLGFRTNKAYARFWEGTTLVQQMRAEWFEACNNLMAFSTSALIKAPNDLDIQMKVGKFRYTLVRLVSLMHGAALKQVTGGDGEEFDVLDVHALDEESLDYLTVECGVHEINRVEVLLHWVQVLITDSIADGVLVVPPPILTRSYQTLSRGMVNLHNVRKLADVPFPFPLSQMIIVLLLIQNFMTPVLVSASVESYVWTFLIAFIPTFGMWSITFISGELEQPFGQDPNDLPLAELQFEMNNSLLMLLDPVVQRAPSLKEDAITDVQILRNKLGELSSSTMVLGENHPEERESRIRDGTRRPRSLFVGSEDSGGPGTAPGSQRSSERLQEKRLSGRSPEGSKDDCFGVGESRPSGSSHASSSFTHQKGLQPTVAFVPAEQCKQIECAHSFPSDHKLPLDNQDYAPSLPPVPPVSPPPGKLNGDNEEEFTPSFPEQEPIGLDVGHNGMIWIDGPNGDANSDGQNIQPLQNGISVERLGNMERPVQISSSFNSESEARHWDYQQIPVLACPAPNGPLTRTVAGRPTFPMDMEPPVEPPVPQKQHDGTAADLGVPSVGKPRVASIAANGVRGKAISAIAEEDKRSSLTNARIPAPKPLRFPEHV